MATNTVALVCPQGHGPLPQGSRFCKWCGATLVAAPAPEQTVAMAAAVVAAAAVPAAATSSAASVPAVEGLAAALPVRCRGSS